MPKDTGLEDSNEYFERWNSSSILLLQIESKTGVEHIDSLIDFEEIDGVDIGPYDLRVLLRSGETDHPLVKEASNRVIEACRKKGKSCGFQIAQVSQAAVEGYIKMRVSTFYYSLVRSFCAQSLDERCGRDYEKL